MGRGPGWGSGLLLKPFTLLPPQMEMRGVKIEMPLHLDPPCRICLCRGTIRPLLRWGVETHRGFIARRGEGQSGSPRRKAPNPHPRASLLILAHKS